MSNVLGTLSFLDIPDVNGTPLVLNSGDVAALEALTTTGLAVRTAADTWTTRTVTGTTGQITLTNGDGIAGNPTIALASNPVLPGLGAVTIPVGATADRPASPTVGMIRYNTTTGVYEDYDTTWSRLGMVKQVVTGTISATTGTTQTPFDNTSPLSIEGNQIWTQSFTPLSSTSLIVIMFSVWVAHGTATRTVICATYRGTTTLTATAATTAAIASAANMTTTFVDSPGSTATITYSARVGSSGSGTVYVNQASTATLGGTGATRYIIMEIE